jgi:hypothetical protein
MITAPKMINLQRDRLGRRRLIANRSTTTQIHPVLAALHGYEFQIAHSKVRLQHSHTRESLRQTDQPRHTFPIGRAIDSAVSCLELC